MMSSRRIVVAVSMLAGVAGVVLGGVAAASLSGCATAVRWLDARRAHRPPFRVVSPAVAYEIVRDTPDVFILDLRAAEDFQGPTGHLRNAFNIPLARLPYRLLEVRTFHAETFLVYCDLEDCGRTGMRILKDSGFQDAILIGDGIHGWIRSGFPTFVRASTRRPPTARVKTEKNPELAPDSARSVDELPVVPPPPPPASAPPPA